MATAQKIRVLIVDDHVMVRQGLRAVLQSYPNIDVVGEAGNGEEALSSVAKLQPTIVVMDISMPSLDGIGATRLIKTQYPQIAVLGLSVNAPSYHVDAMLKAGDIQHDHERKSRRRVVQRHPESDSCHSAYSHSPGTATGIGGTGGCG